MSKVVRAIDGLVNVDMGDQKPPDWMIRVKEDTFRAGDSMLASRELPGAPRGDGRAGRRARDPAVQAGARSPAARSSSASDAPIASRSGSAGSIC